MLKTLSVVHFKIQEHTVKEVTFEIKKGSNETIKLSPETDFEVTPINHSLKKEAQIYFKLYKEKKVTK